MTYSLSKAKNAVTRYYDCFVEKKIHDIAIILNSSQRYKGFYKDVSVGIFYDKKIVLEGEAIFFPHTAPDIITCKIKEHVAYDDCLNPIYDANFLRPDRIGYTDHSALPCYPDFSNSISKIRVIDGTVIYLGTFIFHYGHFILESISRIKEGLSVNGVKFAFHIQSHFNREKVLLRLKSGYWMDYFNALNIDINEIIFIDEPILFENIKISSQSLILSYKNCYISNEARLSGRYINDIMKNNYNGDFKISSEKIYLSRASTPTSKRKLINEVIVENYFFQKGFKIVRPEELSSEYEKHFILSNAKIIAGVPGSGLLNTFFVPEGSITIALEQSEIPSVALNHQIQVDFSCGHSTYVYFSDKKENIEGVVHWSIDVQDLDDKLQSNKILSKAIGF
ncbi:MAG: glycosyltransferase family 61 protein [Methylococcaceae bacterium]|nr:glycosyltransferase family 61 protein [Methylococcaceae bacterium]